MMRVAMMIAAAMVLPYAAFAQDDVQDNVIPNREAIKAVGEEMRAIRLEGHRESFRRQLLEHGMREETVDDYVEQVQRAFGGDPIVINRQPYGSPDWGALEQDGALRIIEEVQTFYRWTLERKMESRMERFDNMGIPLKRPCRGCIDGVEDCIDLVDRLFDICLENGGSLEMCQDQWLTLFNRCEELFEEQCSEDAC